MKTPIIATILIVLIVVIGGGAFLLAPQPMDQNPNTNPPDQNPGTPGSGSSSPPTNGDTVPGVSLSDWMEIEFKDVKTGENFKITDFEGKKILLESFAVWCPICKQQQDQIKLMREQDDEVVHISLDTDPNEDEARVLQHVNDHGYDWYYAVSPIEATNSLIEDFGLTIVNAPSAPLVLICEDHSTRFLSSGVKSASQLSGEVETGC
jgi:hypothetical protein